MPQKKYILIVLLFIFFSGNIIAQLRMGFTAGTLFTTNTLNHAEIGVINQSIPCFCGVKQVETKPVLLYSAGFTVDFVLSDEFFISTKALFAAKGWNEKTHYADFNPGSTAVVYDSKDKYRLNYFELPIYFVFSSALGSKDAKFNIGFGGYVDFALAGKYQFHLLGSQNITNSSGALTDNASEDGLIVLKDSSNLIAINSLQNKTTNYRANSFDIGASVLLGIELGNGIHYDLSLFNSFRNVITGGFYPYPRTNRFIGIGLSVGYFIDKK